MELVNVYNNKHKKLDYVRERKQLEKGEFKLSCFVWIINDKDEILVQQRLASDKSCPNMWGATAGGARAGETSLDTVLRELDEELGIQVDKNNLSFIGSYVRFKDFVEVYLLKSNININNLKLQTEEVQQVKWMKIEEFEQLLSENKASETGYFIFKNYYDNFYNCFECS